MLVTLSASVHVGQTIWLLGLAVTGFALLVAATPRARLIALTPVLAGAVLALLVLPSDPRRMYVVDEAAAELVCDGPVCVTKTHWTRLADLAGPGKEALRLLHRALGDRAPVSVLENIAVLPDGAMPQWSGETVLFDFDDGVIAAAQGEELTRALIAEAMVPGCTAVGWSSLANEDYAQAVAVGWVLGDLRPLPGTEPASLRSEVEAETRPVWKELKALPWAEQLSRINAMRAAALSCGGRRLRRPVRRCVPVRWLTLYARSRQVPASLAAVVISAVAAWALARDGSGAPADPPLPVLVLAAGAMAASIGLGGQDLALDRTAAIRWVPRRAAHVLLAGAVVGTVLLAVQTMGVDMATTAFVVRDGAGLMGLVALGAALWAARTRGRCRSPGSRSRLPRPRRVCRCRWRPGCRRHPARQRAPGRPWSSRSPAPRPTPSRDRDGNRTGPRP
ncbi:hypothetical protein SHIRM173S_01340 [Streptomyces hirsutus]